MIITDGRLKNRVEGPNIVVKIPEKLLDSMDEASLKRHTDSGLIDQATGGLYTMQEAEV